MRCQEDECKVVNKIHQLVICKILVGNDLSLDLKYLSINADCLLEIQNLAAAVVFGKLGLAKKVQFFKLSFINKD